MRRTLAFLAVTGLVLGGGAAAFAATTDGAGHPNAAARAAAKDCMRKARADHAGDKAAIRAAAKECLKAAGIDPGRRSAARKARRGALKSLTPDQRTALKDCVKKARADHESDKAGRRDAVRACLSQAGISLPTHAR